MLVCMLSFLSKDERMEIQIHKEKQIF